MGEAEMVSPRFGLSSWVVGDDICSWGPVEEGAEEALRRKGGDREGRPLVPETAGFAFCMKGRNQQRIESLSFSVIKRTIKFLSTDSRNTRDWLSVSSQ
ncbi:hypothetical protein PBY51_010262 [Eleginops maclovinus]|uniref:Uncharacterized protein n=1 Tax=Eleginops maclovinus TaxID=56733 RepID=A0AAN7XAE1_ELEMC|nr:hypothetical protein PBY51_010262 [Eleginops maclovinus]